MSGWERDIALRYAPVVLQKAHADYFRADYITRVDFAHDWPEVWKNWTAPWEKKADGTYAHRLRAHAYYSVVATETHFFLAYAFYHPQDWAAFWGSPARSRPNRPDQHLHDMEGCLVVVPRADGADLSGRGVVGVITISHWHFFSFAGWEGVDVGLPFNVSGWTEDVDGPILVTDRFAHERGEPPYRFKLYVQSGGHGIKGSKEGWGDSELVVRYRPTRGTPGEPGDTFTREGDIWTQTVPYKLLSVFDRDGLWAQRENPGVMQTDDKGRDTLVVRKGGGFEPGAAKPPWGWDDTNDAHKPGEFAWDPAHLANGYFAGLREFSGQYVHNPYLRIVRPDRR
jgi:hypothetical protein